MVELFQKTPYLLRVLLALVCGVALSYTQSPYEYWALIFPCFSIFYLLYNSAQSKKAVFFLVFVFSMGYFVSGLNWIGNALLVEGNDYRWVWPIAVIALPTLLSLFSALFLTIGHHIGGKGQWGGFLLFCLLLSFAEYTRSYIFTGFPWNLYGYTWLELPIAQSVSIIGPFGLTLLTVFWGAVFGHVVLQHKKSISLFAIAIITFGIFYSYGAVRLKNADVWYSEDVAVTIVQPNIAQKDKWENDKLSDNFIKQIRLSNSPADTGKEIIVWPETAIPLVILENESAKAHFQSILNENRILLSGGLSVLPEEGSEKLEYHNGLFLFDAQGNAKKLYNKSHLVPFGEYIPFQQYIPLTPVVDFVGFKKGDGATTIDLDGWPKLSPQICYEIIFPNRMVAKDAERPDFILTITNDAWYGDSPGPRQHFAQARFRAIEQGLPVVRSANTGISGLIDPYGRVVQSLPLLEAGIIQKKLPQTLQSEPLYSVLGDWFYLIFSFFLSFFLILNKKRFS